MSESETVNQRRALLLKLIHEHAAEPLEIELGGLALSARTFDANVHELLRYVEQFENTLFNPLLVPGKRRELREYAFEVVRLFHNAIAAGESFLEHCRTTVTRRYRKEPFEQEFTTQHEQIIKTSAACMFVRQLRGHLLHKKSIGATVMRQLTDFSDPLEPMHAIRLSTDGIDRDRWRQENPKSVEYLDRLAGGTINIRRLVYEYRATVKHFGDWLLTRERAINTQSLTDLEALYRELEPLLNPLVAEEFAAARIGAGLSSWFVEGLGPESPK